MREAVAAVVRALPAPHLLVSTGGEVVAASAAAAELLGLDDDRRLPPLSEISTDSEQDVIDFLAACCRSDSPLAGAIALRNADGTVRRYRCTGRLIQTATSPAFVVLHVQPNGGPPASRVAPGDAEPPVISRVVGESAVSADPAAAGSGADDHRPADGALRAGEEGYRATFERAAVGMAHVDLDGRWLRVNDRLCEIVGYSRDELYGLDVQALTHPDDLEPDLEQVSRLLSGRVDSYSMEKRYIRKGGAVVWVQLTVSLVRSEMGAPQYFIAVIRDIDRRKATDVEADLQHEALVRERSRLRAVLDLLPAGVWIANADGRIVAANQAAGEIWGGAAPLTADSERYHLEYHAYWPDGTPLRDGDWGLARALKGERTGPQEVVIACFDGTRKTILNYGIPIFDRAGDIVGAAALSVDITHTKQIERSLRRATGQLGVLVRAASGLLAVERPTDLLGEILDDLQASIGVVFCLHYLLEESGPGEAVRLRLEAAVGVPDDFAERYRFLEMGSAVCGTVARDGRSMVVENVQDSSDDVTSVIRSLGVTAYLCHPLIVANKLIGTLSFGLRGRLRFEEHEIDLLKALADQVAVAVHRARVLQSEQRARMEAEAASRAKSAFMATVSHELRTPLNATIGYADLLADGIPEELGPGSLRHVDRIRVASRHLLQLIEELLTFSRLEAGRERVHIEDVPIADLIHEVRAVAEPLAAGAGLAFMIDTSAAPRSVQTDPRKLRQILLNLIGNAVKFTGTGEVRLTVGTVGDDVVFTVTDTGVGIAPDDLAFLFDPFWQADNSTTRKAPGTGLGLTISRRYAQLLGGDVSVDSQPGEGSAFRLRLRAT